MGWDAAAVKFFSPLTYVRALVTSWNPSRQYHREPFLGTAQSQSGPVARATRPHMKHTPRLRERHGHAKGLKTGQRLASCKPGWH